MIDSLETLERMHQEARPLINEHTKLMNGYEQALPHAGWAECKCKLAKKIRKVFDIPECDAGSNAIRLRIDLEEFSELVRGAIIAKTHDGKRVLLALADISFDKMLEQVVLASRFKCAKRFAPWMSSTSATCPMNGRKSNARGAGAP